MGFGLMQAWLNLLFSGFEAIRRLSHYSVLFVLVRHWRTLVSGIDLDLLFNQDTVVLVDVEQLMEWGSPQFLFL